MTLNDIVRELELSPVSVPDDVTVEVTSVYCGDLLSDVLANAEPGALWLTIQGHPNVVSVAQLKDIACVVLVNGTSPDPQTVTKARTHGVPICGSYQTSAELCMALAGRI